MGYQTYLANIKAKRESKTDTEPSTNNHLNHSRSNTESTGVSITAPLQGQLQLYQSSLKGHYDHSFLSSKVYLVVNRHGSALSVF